MKRIMTFILAASIVLLISGCKTQKELNTESTSSGFSSIDDSSSVMNDYGNKDNSNESALTEPDNSTSQNAQVSANKNQPKPSPDSAASTVTATCQHNYRAVETVSSCVSEGYIVYTCTKCGDSYREAIPPSHDYSKYLCERCGKIDPSADKFQAISAWLSTYGEPNGNEDYMFYPNEFAPLSISNPLGKNMFLIEYRDEADDIFFRIFIQGADLSSITVYRGLTLGSFDIKNSTFSSEQKIVFDYFYTPEEDPIDEDTFATECAKKIDTYMLKAQNEIIYPKTGLKLKDFGFTYYQ